MIVCCGCVLPHIVKFLQFPSPSHRHWYSRPPTAITDVILFFDMVKVPLVSLYCWLVPLLCIMDQLYVEHDMSLHINFSSFPTVALSIECSHSVDKKVRKSTSGQGTSVAIRYSPYAIRCWADIRCCSRASYAARMIRSPDWHPSITNVNTVISTRHHTPLLIICTAIMRNCIYFGRVQLVIIEVTLNTKINTMSACWSKFSNLFTSDYTGPDD